MQRNQYVNTHRNVPVELLARQHESETRNLSIFLYEDFLFLYLKGENYMAALAALENDPAKLSGRDWSVRCCRQVAIPSWSSYST